MQDISDLPPESLFPGSPVFVWGVTRETGESKATSLAAPYSQFNSYGEPIVIKPCGHATDSGKVVEWDWHEWQKDLQVRARKGIDAY